MKTMRFLPLATLLLSWAPQADAQTFMDRVRGAFDSTKRTVGNAAHQAGQASRRWLDTAKENLRLSRPEYTRRAGDRIQQSALALQRVKTGPSGVVDRKYFKTRIMALEQHLEYSRAEYAFLQSSPSEVVFRERQKDFDFTLWSLEEAVSLAQSEAGL
jgi:hypothetical protein